MSIPVATPPDLDRITPELLSRFDRPGPRYTSYPTAVEFHDGYTATDYLEHLGRANAHSDRPLSLYVHIPFCARKCTFCGCNSQVADQPGEIDQYLARLSTEIDMLAAALPNRRTLMQYHWGGGTPTCLFDLQLETLAHRVAQHFQIGAGAEVAIEVNPGVTPPSRLSLLRSLGFNRISFGVQDFNPTVLEAIGRKQTEQQVRDLFATARDLKFESINLDLIYGLPGQSINSFKDTLSRVVELGPDRVALYSFAYIPRIMKHQGSILENTLPDPTAKFALFKEAINTFLQAGYLQVGMDHFARPEDEMGQAVASKTLYRNFMGYTVHRATDMLGVGASSIGAVEGAFVQNQKSTRAYQDAIAAGRFPTSRGYELTADDRIRQRVITELMCNFYLSIPAIERDCGIDFRNYFQKELAELHQTMVRTEVPFVEMDSDHLSVTPLGRLFVRNVCMIFDTHLQKKHKDKALFSRTV